MQEEKLLEKDSAVWRLQGDPTVLITLAHIFNVFAPLMVRRAAAAFTRTSCSACGPDEAAAAASCQQEALLLRPVCVCLQCKVYLVEDVLMNFLLRILEGGGSVDEHPLIQQLLDLFWLLMEVNMALQPLTQLGHQVELVPQRESGGSSKALENRNSGLG